VAELVKLKRELQQTLQVLKLVLLNSVTIAADVPEPEQAEVKENVEKEFQKLVDADAELKGLFA
jgi:hypothetical protein